MSREKAFESGALDLKITIGVIYEVRLMHI